jgi:rRNA maturation endonuclease Nob1
MVKCNKCQAENRDERKLCEECGSDVHLKEAKEALAAVQS